MVIRDLTYKSRVLKPHKAIISPDFESRTVLASSHWEYIEMFLKREGQSEALFFWQQAKEFHKASQSLQPSAAPLTLYYCFLNATKALLSCKKIGIGHYHGVSGSVTPGKTNLKNEIIRFQKRGNLAKLSNYFGDQVEGSESMWSLLYNLAFVHRSFTLTYSSESTELFIPIENPRFLISDFQHKGWFYAKLNKAYSSVHVLNKIKGHGYVRDGSEDPYAIRQSRRYKWYYRKPKVSGNISRLTTYHRMVRSNLQYIDNEGIRWYIKRDGVNNIVNRNPACIIFAVMHRLSELARYEPFLLNKHFSLKQNWLLSEFINKSADVFIDIISCEMSNTNISIVR